MKIGISQENELRKFQAVQISEALSCLIKQGFEVLLELGVIIVAGYDDVVYRTHLVSFLE
jgi:NAD/NADP transhydrogenase alpha subunit